MCQASFVARSTEVLAAVSSPKGCSLANLKVTPPRAQDRAHAPGSRLGKIASGTAKISLCPKSLAKLTTPRSRLCFSMRGYEAVFAQRDVERRLRLRQPRCGSLAGLTRFVHTLRRCGKVVSLRDF